MLFVTRLPIIRL